MIEYSRRDDLVEHKVVDGYNLQQCTSAGWVLVASFEETRIDRAQEYYSGAPATPAEAHVVRVVQHVVARPLESALAAAADHCAALVKASEESYEAERASESLRKDAERRLVEAKELAASLANSEIRLSKQVDRLTEQMAKYKRQEIDLGKLRAAIGAIEFDKIVGAK